MGSSSVSPGRGGSRTSVNTLLVYSLGHSLESRKKTTLRIQPILALGQTEQNSGAWPSERHKAAAGGRSEEVQLQWFISEVQTRSPTDAAQICSVF